VPLLLVGTDGADAGDDPHPIGNQDEEEDRGDERQDLAPRPPALVTDDAEDELERYLDDGLQAPRHDRRPPRDIDRGGEQQD